MANKKPYPGILEPIRLFTAEEQARELGKQWSKTSRELKELQTHQADRDWTCSKHVQAVLSEVFALRDTIRQLQRQLSAADSSIEHGMLIRRERAAFLKASREAFAQGKDGFTAGLEASSAVIRRYHQLDRWTK